jgi:transposase-like protein
MGFLDRLFGRKDDGSAATQEKPVDEAIARVECPHGTMAPRWERPEDFGKHDAISSYVCDACGKSFSRDEGERVMAAAGGVARIDESLRKTVEEEKADAEAEFKHLP